MNKVYKDSKLGYSQDEKFDIPEDFELCSSELDNLEPGTDFVEDDEGSLYGDGEIDEFFQ